jgi:DNA-directed RNA polymerase subunit K/omega
VHVVAQRSRQMHDTKYYQMKEKDYKSIKNIGRALEEVAEGLIHVQ